MKKETQHHNFHGKFIDNKNIVGGIAILMNLSSYLIIGCLLYIGKNTNFNQKILIVGGIAILMNLSSYLIFGGLLFHEKFSDNQKFLIVGAIAILMNLSSYLIFGGLLYLTTEPESVKRMWKT